MSAGRTAAARPPLPVTATRPGPGRDQLGDRVLDLEPGVHLHEEELVGRVAGDDELDRARARRSRRTCGPPRSRPPHRPRRAGSSSGDGASSMIFWCRRCRLHSRSPRWKTVPWASASTWISMCRGRSCTARPAACRRRRRRPPPAGPPPARPAGRPRTRPRMPLPPPPAEGLSRTGNHGSFMALSAPRRTARPRPRRHHRHPGRGHPGLGAILSPIASMAAGGGPMKTSPRPRRRGRRRRSRPGSRSRGGSPARRSEPPPPRSRRCSGSSRAAAPGRCGSPRRPRGRAAPLRRRRCTRRRWRCRAAQRADDPDRDLAAVGDQDLAEHGPAPHIRKTP